MPTFDGRDARGRLQLAEQCCHGLQPAGQLLRRVGADLDGIIGTRQQAQVHGLQLRLQQLSCHHLAAASGARA